MKPFKLPYKIKLFNIMDFHSFLKRYKYPMIFAISADDTGAIRLYFDDFEVFDDTRNEFNRAGIVFDDN